MRDLKKNLHEVIAENPGSSVYFFDESRFGTHSKLGHGWFAKGKRSTVKVKLGFQNFYVYSAVRPLDGGSFSIIAPKVNTVCMNIFLAEMSAALGETFAIIVMDCAGWHKAKNLEVPSNIKIMYLPPYSPELNPVERLWRYLKSKTIKNRIYSTLMELEDKIYDSLRTLDQEVIQQLCASNY